MAAPSGSMTFAGQSFVQPSPDLMVKVGRWWDESAPELWRHPGYALERLHFLPVPDRPNQRKPRLNVLYWPTGASRWGTFHGLMTGAQVQALWADLGTDAPTPGTFLMRTDQRRIVNRAVVNTVSEITTPMTLLGVRPVFAGYVDSARSQVSGTNLQIDTIATNIVYPDGYVPQDSDIGQTITIAAPDPPFTAGTYTITGVDGGGWLLSGAAGGVGSTGGVWSSSISTTTADYSRRLYQVTLVDARYFWWTRPLEYDYDDGDSWSDLLRSLLLAASGLTISPVGVPAAYGTPNFLRWNNNSSRPLPLLLDAAAASVGMRIRYNRDGTVQFVIPNVATQNAIAQHNVDAYRIVLGGYEAPESVAGNIPEGVNVVFWGDTPVTVTKTLASLALPAYGSMTGVVNTRAFVGMDQAASVTSPTHADAATQAATDYYGWALSLEDATYRGVCEFETTGMEDRIEWEYYPGLRPLVDDELAKSPIDSLVATERVLTRVVPSDWHDRNVYGDRPSAVSSPTYIVKLTGSGTGVDGGTAWRGLIQKQVGGAVVDNGEIGPSTNYYVMYPTKAEDGTVGNPEVGDLVVAVPDPLLLGRWEFIPKNELETGDCSGCSWLRDVATTGCMDMKVLAGVGRCSCVVAEGTYYPAIYDTDLLGWVRTKMVTTCCGCGLALFDLTNTVATGPVVRLLGMHVSCAGGSGSGAGALFDLVMGLECCGVDRETGQPYAIFSGWGPEPCDETQAPCGNFFRIKVRCGATCPDTICSVCCGDESAPFAWKFGPLGGFDDNTLNGWWVLPFDGGDEKWEADCNPGAASGGGITSVLEYLSTGVLRLTHGGAVYEADVATWNCCGNNDLTWVSGTDPGIQTEIAVQPVGGAGSCSPPCSLPASLNVSTSNASCAAIGSLNVTVTQVGDTAMWTYSAGSTTVTMDCFAGIYRVAITGVCSDAITPVTGQTVGPPDVRTSDPFYLQFTDALFQTNAGGCPDCVESSTGTITVTA